MSMILGILFISWAWLFGLVSGVINEPGGGRFVVRQRGVKIVEVGRAGLNRVRTNLGKDNGVAGRTRKIPGVLEVLDGVFFEKPWARNGGEEGGEEEREEGGKPGRDSVGSTANHNEDGERGQETNNRDSPPTKSKTNKRVLKPFWQKVLFVMTSWDAARAILANEDVIDQNEWSGVAGWLASLGSKIGIKFFAPRLLFVIGGFARGLQMNTGVQKLFKPSVGVAGLVNAGAIWVNAGWLPKIIFGWVVSEKIWDVCGASLPSL